MKYKLDENFGPAVPPAFQQHGLDCQTVHGEGLAGADDATVLAAAVAEDRILVTLDHDFGNVVAYPLESTRGVAVINPPGRVSRGLLAVLLESFVVACEQGQLRGKLWIVEPGRIREHQATTESETE
jgi:predicted nuclease of predicted toxin-antitoxin system